MTRLYTSKLSNPGMIVIPFSSFIPRTPSSSCSSSCSSDNDDDDDDEEREFDLILEANGP